METIHLDADISWVNLLFYKKAISKMSPGNRIVISVAHKETAENLAKLIRRSKEDLLYFTPVDNGFQLTVKKNEDEKNNTKGG